MQIVVTNSKYVSFMVLLLGILWYLTVKNRAEVNLSHTTVVNSIAVVGGQSVELSFGRKVYFYN